MSVMSWDAYNASCESDDDDDWIDKAVANGMGFKSNEERQQYIDAIGDPLEHPLFAENEDAMKNHPLAKAFQGMKEEELSHYKNALVYKDEGNMFVKKGTLEYYAKARDKYKAALEYIAKHEKGEQLAESKDCSEVIKNTTIPVIPQKVVEEEAATQAQTDELKAQIYSNLSLIELSCKNYRQCVEYSNEVIVNIPGTNKLKAHFRKCKSLSGMKKHTKCSEACDVALAHMEALIATAVAESQNTDALKKTAADLTAMRTQCQSEINKAHLTLIANANAMIKRSEKAEVVYREAWEICQQHKIRLSYGQVTHPQQLKVWYPHYDPETPKGTEKTPLFPVLLLYPQHNKFDILSGVNNLDEMLAYSLIEIFPEPEDEEEEEEEAPTRVAWDVDGEYHISNLNVFMHVHPVLTSSSGSGSGSGGLISTADEWVYSCHALNEIKTGVNSFVKPIENSGAPAATKPASAGLTVFDKLTGKYDASVEGQGLEPSGESTAGSSSKKLFLRRNAHYMEQLKTEQHRIDTARAGTNGNLLVNVHVGCTLRQVLNCPGVVLSGGLLTLIVYPKINNKAADAFVKKNVKDRGFATKYLCPDGKLADSEPVL